MLSENEQISSPHAKHHFLIILILREHPCGVMVKALDYGIVVSEFKLKSCYYTHFRTNTFEKGMNPLILQTMC